MYENSKLMALWAKSNSGKTKTIAILIDLLILNGGKILYYKEFDCDNRLCIINFNDKTIGITTHGDTRALLEKDFKELDEKNIEIDIYICASHIKGQTVDYLRSAFKAENICWLEKSRLSCETGGKFEYDFYYTNNYNQAENMLYLLKRII